MQQRTNPPDARARARKERNQGGKSLFFESAPGSFHGAIYDEKFMAELHAIQAEMRDCHFLTHASAHGLMGQPVRSVALLLSGRVWMPWPHWIVELSR